jgi:hypothetical protein
MGRTTLGIRMDEDINKRFDAFCQGRAHELTGDDDTRPLWRLIPLPLSLPVRVGSASHDLLHSRDHGFQCFASALAGLSVGWNKTASKKMPSAWAAASGLSSRRAGLERQDAMFLLYFISYGGSV